MGRISNRFATLYVAGCLAIRLKIFPFTEAEVLAALLTCHRDHVAFIDEQLKTPPGSRPALIRSPMATTAGEPIAPAVVPAPTPFDRLRDFIERNIIPHRGKRDKVSVRLRNGQLTCVYIRDRKGETEYWLPNDLFEEVVGNSGDAETLKKDLHVRGLLKTVQRGAGLSYVVKRSLSDGTRPFFVVIRHTPKKSPGRGQALAAAATV